MEDLPFPRWCKIWTPIRIPCPLVINNTVGVEGGIAVQTLLLHLLHKQPSPSSSMQNWVCISSSGQCRLTLNNYQHIFPIRKNNKIRGTIGTVLCHAWGERKKWSGINNIINNISKYLLNCKLRYKALFMKCFVEQTLWQKFGRLFYSSLNYNLWTLII